MNMVNQRIKDLGFELNEINYQLHTIEYLHKEGNRIVLLQWDEKDDECVIYCRDADSEYDDFGHELQISNGIDINEAHAFIDKLKEMKNNTNHVSVGVYSNGRHKVNVVRDEDLESHIEYNKTLRWGRGLFVDGICLNQGYLSGDQVKKWIKRIKTMDIDITQPTIPYK